MYISNFRIVIYKLSIFILSTIKTIYTKLQKKKELIYIKYYIYIYIIVTCQSDHIINTIRNK